jgi:molybdenum-dependent DNA-binding transcriptional regulator ModE
MEQTKRQSGRIKYPGISEHAKQLGVSRLHLWMVLQGRRESRRLMHRYRKLAEDLNAQGARDETTGEESRS